MTGNGIFQIIVFLAVVVALTKPMGAFMAAVFEGRRTFLHPVLRPVEVLAYKCCGVRERTEQRWTQYTASLLAFSLFSFLFMYLLQRFQGALPLNPQGFGRTLASPDLAFNTAISFLTNTDWQSYSGEATFSYFVQTAALTVQNFASAAAGMAVAIALTRGFTRQQVNSLGNFWVDVTRGTVYILLPISFLAALFFCSQGVIQNFHPYTTATTLEGAKQVMAQGPVASQEAIKLLGTNGGGFFHANSAHPFENPTPLTNFAQMILLFLIPAGLTYTFGRMVGDHKQGWAIFWVFTILCAAGALSCYWAEQRGNPMLARAGVQMHATAAQPGGNMEGKEMRFGIAASALFATVTTDASSSATNASHDSFTPFGGFVPLFNIEMGGVIFGGVGAGLYGILLRVMLTVFIAGLLIGRTPGFLGKRIEQKEVKMSMFALLATAFSILVFTAASSAESVNHGGAHGFTQTLYAYSSVASSSGSAFAGLNANTPWYNLTLGLAMLIGRFLLIIPLMAAAGSLAMKKKTARTRGTFPTHGPLFVTLLIGVTVFIGALTFFPALVLGPIVEHFLMEQGRLFSLLLLPWEA